MRFLHIVFEPPAPNGTGASLRNYSIGLSLSRLGQSSTISVQSMFHNARRYPDRKPSRVEATIPDHVLDQITEQVAQNAPDTVIIDGVFLADVANRLTAAGHRVIIDMHNIESDLQKALDLAHRNPWRRMMAGKRWTLARAAERAVSTTVDGIWVCSDNDAGRLRDFVGTSARINVIPNPIPAWCTPAIAPPTGSDWSVKPLFVGHLGYRPNANAATRLATRIVPDLAQIYPSTEMVICGRSPRKHLRKLLTAAPHVRLVENPDSVAPFYQAATVALIPLTEGGGTRLKILEAMATGVPVIASAKAAEGLAVTDGETFLLAESDADFVAATCRLANDARLRNHLIQAAFAFVTMHHGPDAMDRAIRASVCDT